MTAHEVVHFLPEVGDTVQYVAADGSIGPETVTWTNEDLLVMFDDGPVVCRDDDKSPQSWHWAEPPAARQAG
jgi:hypothetical protein